MRRLQFPVRAALTVLALCGAARAQAPPSPDPPAEAPVESAARASAGSLIAPGKTPDLLLVSTGDVIGYVDPCG